MLLRQHFHFWGTRELNALYLTLGLAHFGVGLVSIFVPIYLWELGFSLSKILLFFFLEALYFAIVGFFGISFITKLKPKMMMFLGILLLIISIHGLGLIPSYQWLFYLLPAAMALHALLFNGGYHLDFAIAAQKDHIGEEVGVRNMVTSLFALAAPFIGGIFIATKGFEFTFYVSIAILFVSVAPLFFFPEKNPVHEVSKESMLRYLDNKHVRPLNISAVGYAAEFSISSIMWPLFLFIIVQDIKQFGGIISMGLFVMALINFLLGYLADKGMRRKILKYSTGILSAVWLSRALFPFAVTPLTAINHIIGKMIHQGVLVAWTSQYYKIAQTVAEPVAFIFSRELLYHLSRVALFAVLIIFAAVFSASTVFIVSFVFAAGFSLLFLYANKLHTDDLRDGFIIKRKI